MEHYAGIDVSLESASLCVVDATGRIVREAKVASDPDVLIGWVIVLRWRGFASYFTLATFSGRAAASPREGPMVRIRLPPATSQQRTVREALL
jgi:hypothetical protein